MSTLSRLLPTTITTTASGPRRIFSSFALTFHRSAASTATQNQNLSCTVSITTARHYSKKKRMPPKKAVKEEKILLGRPGNNLKSGIVCNLFLRPQLLANPSQVGLANVGKSTLFQAITKCSLGNPAVRRINYLNNGNIDQQ